MEPPAVEEEVIYLSYEESKGEAAAGGGGGGGGGGVDASEEKIVEVQLPDGRTVRLQMPGGDQADQEALAAADIVGTVEGVD